jgi:hypothetical protein|tara:strand:+ start:1381 stop:1656 length:276 start_codon:yes stop_codon:yes gene_type:complete
MTKLRSQENTVIDLEEKIMAAWQTISDIDLVYYAMEDMSEDEQMNAMLGLKELGEARFKDLWRVFEQFVPAHYQAIKFQSAVASDDADIQL